MEERQFGRLESDDPRDKLFPVSAILHETPIIREKYWWADGWWGNQGSSSMCVAFSWIHWLEDGPVVQDANSYAPKPLMPPDRLYKEAQLRDQFPGENYNGTTVRAGAKILKQLGLISEYRWANGIQDVINTLLTLGPMVVGTRWFENMSKPDSKHIMHPTGKSLGGHAYILNGVNVDKEMFRIKNSWGQGWGNKGYAFISFNDFDRLLNTSGEACIAREIKLKEDVDWSKLSPPEILRD